MFVSSTERASRSGSRPPRSDSSSSSLSSSFSWNRSEVFFGFFSGTAPHPTRDNPDPARSWLSCPRLACRPDRAPAALATQARVHFLHSLEDDLRGPLRLLLARLGDPLEAQRLAELHGDLRGLQLAPGSGVFPARDRPGGRRRARPERAA